MVSKIKGPRNYLSCCHVPTAMGRGGQAGGAPPQKGLGCQAHCTRRTLASAPPWPHTALLLWAWGTFQNLALSRQNLVGAGAFPERGECQKPPSGLSSSCLAILNK